MKTRRSFSTVVFTTSAIAVSEAFGNMPPVSVRTPLHAPLPLVGPLSPPATRYAGALHATATAESITSSLSQEFKSFLSGSSSSDREILLIQKNSRYGGRATGIAKGIKSSYGSASTRASGINTDASDYNYNYDKGKLGFDLKMVSSMDSSDFSTIQDNVRKGRGAGPHARKASGGRTVTASPRFGFKIDKLNPSSPIKKRIASNLRPHERSGNSYGNVSDFFENGEGPLGTSASENATKKKSSSVPGWFPYTPTRSQIERLKVVELKDACEERGLHKVCDPLFEKFIEIIDFSLQKPFKYIFRAVLKSVLFSTPFLRVEKR